MPCASACRISHRARLNTHPPCANVHPARKVICETQGCFGSRTSKRLVSRLRKHPVAEYQALILSGRKSEPTGQTSTLQGRTYDEACNASHIDDRCRRGRADGDG